MDYFSLVVAGVAFLVSLLTLWDKVDQRKKILKEPTTALEERVKIIEDKLNLEYTQRFLAYDAHFKQDLKRIEAIEEGNKITQQALLALINHAIDGNDVEEIRNASRDLTNYLIRR
jgi:hypothetical protein